MKNSYATNATMTEQTRWTSISWHALLILNRLRTQAELSQNSEYKKKGEYGREDEAAHEKKNENATDEQRRYIEHRLRELAEWERRIAENKLRIRR